MATISTTKTIQCDNCGVITTTALAGWEHALPSMSLLSMGAMNFIGDAPDYCPACIEAVRIAIEVAKSERRRLTGVQS